MIVRIKFRFFLKKSGNKSCHSTVYTNYRVTLRACAEV